MSDIIDARRESFFLIDTETLDTKDTAIVTDISMVFVNLNGLFIEHYNSGNYDPISFNEFFKNEDYVKRLTLFPSLNEQREYGATISENTINFWKDQYKETESEAYKEYIKKLLSNKDKNSLKETVDIFEKFVYTCLDKIPSTVQRRDMIPYLERSAGFDTNKYYNILEKAYGKANHESAMKYWVRREYRTITSCNRWRIPSEYLQPNTTSWSDALRNTLEKDVKDYEFTKHIAINDCLIDAYMIYFLKMTIENFYI